MLQMNDTTEAARGVERGCHGDIVAARWRRLATVPGVRYQLLDRFALEMESTGYCERNIENFIGTARLPMGLAGPLRVCGYGSKLRAACGVTRKHIHGGAPGACGGRPVPTTLVPRFVWFYRHRGQPEKRYAP